VEDKDFSNARAELQTCNAIPKDVRARKLTFYVTVDVTRVHHVLINNYKFNNK